jgi:hypothetical protein
MRLNSIPGIPGRGLFFNLHEAFEIAAPVFAAAGMDGPIRLKPAFDSVALDLIEKESTLVLAAPGIDLGQPETGARLPASPELA